MRQAFSRASNRFASAAAHLPRRPRGKMAAFAFSCGAATATSTAVVFAFWGNSAAPAEKAAAAAQSSKATDDENASLPVISLEEVHKHRNADSIWVTYEGIVYDVTPFINNHPGGKELLLTAGGLDLGHFFGNYKVHTQSDKAHDYLAGMKIGRLTAEDARIAQRSTTPEVHVESRMRVLGNARTRMLQVVCVLPFWILVRLFVRILGLIIPPLAHAIADCLPVSVPGYGGARRIAATKKDGARTRVAVIGGGIAGCGCAYALARSGYDVTVYEGRKTLSGNARSFDWDVKGRTITSCVSVTAWPPNLYKNYVALLKQIDVKTTPIHLSWFLNSKVPGAEGFLWAADPSKPEGSLRNRFSKDFDRYGMAVKLVDSVTRFASLQWFQEPSMYSLQSGLGVLNPFATWPLHHLCRWFGVSQEWWDVVFTPHYTASFLTDKLDNLVAVSGPLIEQNIPLLPNDRNSKDNVLTTCETWADAGNGIREAFAKLTKDCTVKTSTRVLKVNELPKGELEVVDDVGGVASYDRVVMACPCNAVGNILHEHNWIEDAILATPEYADDHHPATGHMHGVMHNDASIIAPEFREQVLKHGSNYVEITRMSDGSINIENTYNFGVQTPEALHLPLSEKPPMLITHALGEGKSIDPKLIRGEGNHARAHPLYSGWNVAAMLSLRLAQGRRGVYYCANYTTPGNCHDMSLNSGLNCAKSIGAEYPFEDNTEARKDFYRLRSLMGL